MKGTTMTAKKIRNKKNPKNKKIFMIVLILILAVAIGAAAFTYFLGPISHGEGEPISISIPTGSTLDDISTKLADNGLIRNKNIFKIYIRVTNKQDDLKAGMYTFTTAMNIPAIAQKIIEGKSDTTVITIKEGLDLNRISLALQDTGLFTAQEFLDEIKNNFDYYKELYPFLASVPADREYKLEGYLFGDTYEVYMNATPRDVIIKMLDRFNEVFKAEYYDRCKTMGITVDQAVIMASLVEREGILDSELPTIAGVFYNRLEDGMLLQSCATLQYIYKDYQFSFTSAQMKVESPYNTYIHKGLPAGPIANFRETALVAALYPEENSYYYFCTKNDGTGASAFAKTLAEHNANIKKYGGTWN